MASSSHRKSDSSGSEPVRRRPSVSLDDAGYESKTLGSIRLEREREQRKAARAEKAATEKRRSRAPITIIAIAGALAIACLVAYIVVVNTDMLDIDRIEFDGVEHLTEEEVGALVNVPQGTTLLNVDTSSIEASLERDAWVQDVEVHRIFPDKLIIEVIERKIAAIAEVPMGADQHIQDWAISDDGIWLMAIPDRGTDLGKRLSDRIYEDAESVLHIEGIPYGVEPKIGAKCTDESIENALDIVTGMTTELADRVKTVTATDAESTLLTLDDNIEIAFGDKDNIREKERICLKIMEENPKVVYINVRVPDRPTWRSA